MPKNKEPRQAHAVSNDKTGVVVRLLLPPNGRLSKRQEREARQDLAPPGYPGYGKIRESPLKQQPFPGQETYEIVQAGRAEGSMSDLYFVPTSQVPKLLEKLGGEGGRWT